MNIKIAEKTHKLMSQIEDIKVKIDWITKTDIILGFNEKSNFDKNKFYFYEYKNEDFREILDKHHKMIIQELKEKIKELEKQIEEL